MSCLDDRTLLELSDGEALPEARGHLAVCPRCANRAAELERDLALLTRVLREAPIPPTARRTKAIGWLVPAASLAALALAAFVGSRGPTSEVPPEAQVIRREAPTVASEERRLREVSRALFALDPLDPVVQLRRENELGLVEAALGGMHPCERGDAGCAW